MRCRILFCSFGNVLLKLCLGYLSIKCIAGLMLELHCWQSLCDDWTLRSNGVSCGKLLCDVWALHCDWYLRCGYIFGRIGNSVLNMCDWDVPTKRKPSRV